MDRITQKQRWALLWAALLLSWPFLCLSDGHALPGPHVHAEAEGAHPHAHPHSDTGSHQQEDCCWDELSTVERPSTPVLRTPTPSLSAALAAEPVVPLPPADERPFVENLSWPIPDPPSCLQRAARAPPGIA
ncbi:MAG: hypothetical protein KatS3mg115_0497 [Candidatus Poribacteria bacterium]|nr:MAG: hypothetical protein KatS3mg115_0497 [Candidatus Poribacteria bacterium]